MRYFIIFLLIPFAEIACFIFIGGYIGLLPTLALAFLTAIIGGAIIRYQGLYTLAAMQGTMREGRMPVEEIFNGFCLVASGALLITPGFVTDAIGFALLLPFIRNKLRGIFGQSKIFTAQSHGFSAGPFQQTDNVIDGEYERVEDEPDKRLP